MEAGAHGFCDRDAIDGIQQVFDRDDACFSFSQRPGIVEAKDVHRRPIKETTNLNILTQMN